MDRIAHKFIRKEKQKKQKLEILLKRKLLYQKRICCPLSVKGIWKICYMIWNIYEFIKGI